ncbi:MAG: YaaR family protein [Tissierellia bacterium]|nr:YaaR family protein [Tissierellia bacterium]
MTRIRRVGMDSIHSTKAVKSKSQAKVYETFKQKLNRIEQAHIRQELELLFDRISVQTDKMRDKLFIEDLIEYKELIGEFLNITVSNSHVFYKENSLDRRGRHRVYSLVKRVDKELDELTKDFLNIEDNRIKILRRLDDIKGMLLDILT